MLESVCRGTEVEEQIQKRLRNARAELEQGKSPGLFDHILVNDDLESCYEKLKVSLELLLLEPRPVFHHNFVLKLQLCFSLGTFRPHGCCEDCPTIRLVTLVSSSTVILGGRKYNFIVQKITTFQMGSS